jgi:DNA-directed RNA polymerase subunit RPC12/RpoP
MGDREKLRAELNVSSVRLEAWLGGFSRPPDSVFLRAVDIITEYENRPPASPERVELKLGSQTARCLECDTPYFLSPVPARDIRNTTELTCLSCGFRCPRGDLIVTLASDIAHWSTARVVAARRMLESGGKLPEDAAEPPDGDPAGDSTERRA